MAVGSETRFGEPPSRVTLHQVFSVIQLGLITVMGLAPELEVFRPVITAKCERIAMMELKPAALGAAATISVNMGALMPVALAHRSPDPFRQTLIYYISFTTQIDKTIYHSCRGPKVPGRSVWNKPG